MTPTSPQVAQGSVVTRFETVGYVVWKVCWLPGVTQEGCIADLISGPGELPCRVSSGQSMVGGSW